MVAPSLTNIHFQAGPPLSFPDLVHSLNSLIYLELEEDVTDTTVVNHVEAVSAPSGMRSEEDIAL